MAKKKIDIIASPEAYSNLQTFDSIDYNTVIPRYDKVFSLTSVKLKFPKFKIFLNNSFTS